MNVEFLCRFTKPVDKEIIDEVDEHIKEQKLIYGDQFDEDMERDKLIFTMTEGNRYEYAPLTFDLKDVKLFNSADSEDHVSLRFYGGESFIIKCHYEKFKQVYQYFSGKLIQPFTNPEHYNFENIDGEQGAPNKNNEKS